METFEIMRIAISNLRKSNFSHTYTRARAHKFQHTFNVSVYVYESKNLEEFFYNYILSLRCTSEYLHEHA